VSRDPEDGDRRRDEREAELAREGPGIGEAVAESHPGE
jgi:hypothetical protein